MQFLQFTHSAKCFRHFQNQDQTWTKLGDFHTHLEGMCTVRDSSGPLLCLWGPPSPGWAHKVLLGMRTPSPLSGRTPDVCPGRSGLCPASSLIWGIPRWKAGSGSCFYTSWQVTGPAPRFHRLLCLLERCPPRRERVAIPAQDSWRTTVVPCMRKTQMSPSLCPSRLPVFVCPLSWTC